jgi:transposase InsO family protein
VTIDAGLEREAAPERMAQAQPRRRCRTEALFGPRQNGGGGGPAGGVSVLQLHRAQVARGLQLGDDHGSNHTSGDFQDESKRLGIEASPSLVREPQRNGVAERFIRTLKENLLWVRTFKTVEEVRRPPRIRQALQ